MCCGGGDGGENSLHGDEEAHEECFFPHAEYQLADPMLQLSGVCD